MELILTGQKLTEGLAGCVGEVTTIQRAEVDNQ